MCSSDLVFQGRSFMTACCAAVDAAGALSFASAGHPPLLVRRAAGGVESAGPHGTMLGIFEDLPLQPESHFQLAAGDAALLYSDGLFSLMNAEGERFTTDDVRATVSAARPGKKFLQTVVGGMGKRSNGEPREDDLAALAVVRL